MPEGRYAADDIEVLPLCEAVRRRPHMYVGDPALDSSLTALVLEPLCFAVDEKTGGPAQQVEFSLLGDECVEVANDGPGLPLGSRRVDGKEVSFVELIMTRLFGCRSMKTDETRARWCHVGVAALCALSEWLVVTVRRDGSSWEQRFSRGESTGPLVRIGEASGSGTVLRFKPDRTILKGQLDVSAIEAKLAEFRRDVPCTTVTLRNLRTTPSRE